MLWSLICARGKARTAQSLPLLVVFISMCKIHEHARVRSRMFKNIAHAFTYVRYIYEGPE